MPPHLNFAVASQRLILRRLQRDDLFALCAYRSLPEVARYQSWEFFGLDDAQLLIDSQADREPGVPGTWLQLGIVEAATHCLIGDCGLHFIAKNPCQIEFGITLAPQSQEKGYAAETINRLLPFVFRDLGAHRVFAITDVLNHAAATLFRRLGFRQEAHFIDQRDVQRKFLQRVYVRALASRVGGATVVAFTEFPSPHQSPELIVSPNESSAHPVFPPAI
jgi:RimJ/RimL family protein N-acetyltransferase